MAIGTFDFARADRQAVGQCLAIVEMREARAQVAMEIRGADPPESPSAAITAVRRSSDEAGATPLL